MFFFCSGVPSEYPVTFHHHISLAFYSLQRFLRLPLFLKTDSFEEYFLGSLQSVAHYRIWLMFFSWLDSIHRFFGRKITEVRHHSYYIISRACTVNRTLQWWLPGQGSVCQLTVKSPLPPFPYCVLWKQATKSSPDWGDRELHSTSLRAEKRHKFIWETSEWAICPLFPIYLFMQSYINVSIDAYIYSLGYN